MTNTIIKDQTYHASVRTKMKYITIKSDDCGCATIYRFLCVNEI